MFQYIEWLDIFVRRLFGISRTLFGMLGLLSIFAFSS